MLGVTVKIYAILRQMREREGRGLGVVVAQFNSNPTTRTVDSTRRYAYYLKPIASVFICLPLSFPLLFLRPLSQLFVPARLSLFRSPRAASIYFYGIMFGTVVRVAKMKFSRLWLHFQTG